MQLAGDKTNSNQRRRWWLAIFTAYALIAAPMPEPRLEEPSICGDDVQQTDLNSFVTQSQSRKSFIREEPSYQTLLTAGDRSPGPSDAPCLVETSTAHDELLFRITLIEATIHLWHSSSASNLAHKSQMPILLSPEMLGSPQNHVSSLYGRRNPSPPLQANVKLGFQFVGCLNFGPLKFLKPNYKRCDPIQTQQKPRSVLNSFCQSLAQLCVDCLNQLIEDVSLKRQSPLLLWLYKNPMRTLPLDPPRDVCYELKSLKKNDIMFPIPRRRWFYGCHRSFLSYFFPTPLDIESKQFLICNNCKAQILWGYKEDIANLKKNPEPLQRIPPDYQTVVSLFLADGLFCLAPLVSARNSALEPSSTSPSLLTVTNASSNASLVDEPSTNLAITCAKLLHSFCLQALKEPLSNSFNYPLMVFKNALLSFVVNSEIPVSCYSLNLVLI